MLDTDRPEQTVEDDALAEPKPASVALVPLTPSGHGPQRSNWLWSRPNSTFITHLIATAAHAPQTCSLRRATPAEAQTAYGAKQPAFQSASFRTRQII
jgi:hypothetical protein